MFASNFVRVEVSIVKPGHQICTVWSCRVAEQGCSGTAGSCAQRHGDAAPIACRHAECYYLRQNRAATTRYLFLLYFGSHLTTQPVAYVERPSSDSLCVNASHGVEPYREALDGYAGVIATGGYEVTALHVTPFC